MIRGGLAPQARGVGQSVFIQRLLANKPRQVQNDGGGGERLRFGEMQDRAAMGPNRFGQAVHDGAGALAIGQARIRFDSFKEGGIKLNIGQLRRLGRGEQPLFRRDQTLTGASDRALDHGIRRAVASGRAHGAGQRAVAAGVEALIIRAVTIDAGQGHSFQPFGENACAHIGGGLTHLRGVERMEGVSQPLCADDRTGFLGGQGGAAPQGRNGSRFAMKQARQHLVPLDLAVL